MTPLAFHVALFATVAISHYAIYRAGAYLADRREARLERAGREWDYYPEDFE